MKVVVLGCGMVGGAIACDLARNQRLQVTAADSNVNALNIAHAKAKDLQTVTSDLAQPSSIENLVLGADVVVNSTPGWLGFSVFQQLISMGKNVVDIAFFSEDARTCSNSARNSGATAVFDCGVAPGLSNMFVGEAASKLDSVKDVRIFVGGLVPQAENIYNYRAVFSPSDVLEEYVRPARVKIDGVIQQLEALSHRETFISHELGSLEAFVTDGLRSLLDTIDSETMIEKTLRFPGHADQAALLRDTGLLSLSPINVDGCPVVPRNLTSELLFPIWKFRSSDRDVTVMRVVVKGEKDGAQRSITYDLFDRFDESSGTSSMARTTGFTAAAVVHTMLHDSLPIKGVCAPEVLGQHEKLLTSVQGYLEERGVNWTRTEH
ncbi:MAG: saccharopine dehydrogenase NADP-binding domain-containing protein [Bdellovibrionales bacterium]|nr:saccharopine dehydrogenase NADP-binding domain-containing protein [Bdellovibrionales bacterium]